MIFGVQLHITTQGGKLMADYFCGRISVPLSYFNSKHKDFLTGEGFEPNDLLGIAELSDDQARYGEFSDLEGELISREIPFDRYSEGKYEYIECTRYYRPASNDSNAMDQEIQTCQSCAIIYVESLKKIIQNPSFDANRKNTLIEELIKENEFIGTPLRECLYKEEISEKINCICIV